MSKKLNWTKTNCEKHTCVLPTTKNKQYFRIHYPRYDHSDASLFSTNLVEHHHLYNLAHDSQHCQAPVLDLRKLQRRLLGRILLVEVRSSLLTMSVHEIKLRKQIRLKVILLHMEHMIAAFLHYTARTVNLFQVKLDDVHKS